MCQLCEHSSQDGYTHLEGSVTMDTWSKEQVEAMKQNGNLKSNAYYNPNEVRNPPPTNMIEQERDSELEKYIRSKYEFKRFIDRSAPATSEPGPPLASSSQFPSAPQSKSAPARSLSAATSPNPPRGASLGYRPSTTAGVKPVSQPSQVQPQPSRSVSQPLPSQPPPPSSVPQKPSNNPVWDDLISLQGSSTSSSLPLQYQPNAQTSGPTQPIAVPNVNPYATATTGSPFGQTQMTSPNAIPSASGGMGMGSISMDQSMGGGSIGMGGTNPFQQPSFNANAFSSPGGAGAAPNPFSQSYLSPGATGAANPFASMGGQPPQPQSSPFQSQIQPFSQTPAAQQFQASLLSQSQPQTFFQPQPQPPAQQVQQPFGQQPSPFAQQPSPYGQQQPSPFGQQPSPFGHQPSPQLQTPQQPQQMLSPGNPFGSWQQQQPSGYPAQQGGFGGQQWGGM